MPATETFVVRFYRRTTNDVAGTVEAVSDGSMWSFVGFDQLRAILEAGVPQGRGLAPRSPKSPKGPR